MGMMILLQVMSRSDWWYPSVPGDRGWNHHGESCTGTGERMDDEEDRGQHAGDDRRLVKSTTV